MTGPPAFGRRTLPRVSSDGISLMALPPVPASASSGLSARASPVAADDIFPTIDSARDSLARLAASSSLRSTSSPSANAAPVPRASASSDQAAENARQSLARLAAISGQRAAALPSAQPPAPAAIARTSASSSGAAGVASVDVARESLARLSAARPALLVSPARPTGTDRVSILSPTLLRPAPGVLAAASRLSPPMPIRKVQSVPGILFDDDDDDIVPTVAASQPGAGVLSWDGGVVTGRGLAAGPRSSTASAGGSAVSAPPPQPR